ncbi:zinc metalloproteinase nas-14-like [Schistocerca piceifrons]|uniref:zinc metalloproteinase nas-14-like n=1 Tax=Schistocerca piceifrons TaxID=274613 RepID=UPI001F5F883A|nr:zinc metalloproteinase nas-14-like [Schistocerca piceifrons]
MDEIYSRMPSITIFLLTVAVTSVIANRVKPPEPAHKGQFSDADEMKKIATKVSSWSPNDEVNVWEMSGLFEGDIMMAEDNNIKNIILDEDKYWPSGVLPYYIVEEDFSEEEVEIIHKAIKDYKKKTCVSIRPYRKGDEDFVMVQGNNTGCWSYVGRKNGGQVLNLQTPGCVHHGIVIHEFLHALGFYHQQSAHNRDDYVKILWENIKEGKEGNFRKYNETLVTDYGIGYDYGSIMHYSKKAFSKNGEPTIVPLEEDAVIGQRDGLSEKDIKKIKKTYKCNEKDSLFSIFSFE